MYKISVLVLFKIITKNLKYTKNIFKFNIKHYLQFLKAMTEMNWMNILTTWMALLMAVQH